MAIHSESPVTTKFQHVLDHLDVVVSLTEARLARARAQSTDTSRDGLLAFVVQDLSEDLEGEVGMEILALLERSPGPKVKVPYRFDGLVTRAFAYCVPVLAAAKLWDRDITDVKRGPEIVELVARTAIWLLGRSPLPDLHNLGKDRLVAQRIAGLWLSRLSIARGMPSSLGGILSRGLDYFAMWACGAVANHYYDDFELTHDEAMDVARQALDFKLALVTALVRTARADGRLSFEEEEMLTLFLDHLSFSQAEKEASLASARPGAPEPDPDVLRAVKLPAHREYIVARAVEMAFADLKETRSEKEAVRALARALGVPQSVVEMHEATMRALNRAIAS